MRLNSKLLRILTVAILAGAVPAGLSAQSSSINAFSPYSFYGIGDIITPGTASMRSMAGAGLGFRSASEMNYINPAAYGAIGQKSLLFSISGEGQNYYLHNADTKSSFNSFNIRDVGISMPLAKNLGFGLIVAPYSEVGYRVNVLDNNPISHSDIGQVKYLYEGEGGITQFKAGIGWKITDRILIGAELAYYHGNIGRYYQQEIKRITGTGAYSQVNGRKTERVNSFFGTFGIQADLISRAETKLTLGATYQMGGKMNSDVTEYVLFNPTFSSGTAWQDYLRFTQEKSDFSLPTVYSAGLYLTRPKWSAAADYSYSDWGNENHSDITNDVTFHNTHTIKVGAKYTPNANDIRRFMNKVTYRAGVRYSNYYMNVKGTPINETAFTFGVGIPLGRTGVNKLDLGIEYGMRGAVTKGLIKENIFKFSIGFTLFGDDEWFVRYKYN